MVIPRFVERALKGEPLLIYGTGKQTRCFASVEDVVRGLPAWLDCPSAAGRVYNIGSTEEITIEDLAKKIIAMTGSSSTLRYLSYEEAYGKPFDDMARRVPSLARRQQPVGYQPRYSLDDTLQPVIQDASSRLDLVS